MADALILEARKKYHQSLIENKVLSITETGVASDSNNTPSQEIANWWQKNWERVFARN